MKLCGSCGRGFVSPGWTCPWCGTGPQNRRGFLSFPTEEPNEGESYLPEYFPQLFELEKGSFWFRHRTRIILHAMSRYFPSEGNTLEIGCGTGFILSEIRKRHPHMMLSGSDLFAEGLQYASSRVPDAAFYQMDACRMPFDSEFDLILALDILEHIEDDTKALGEIYRSIRPGGGLIVTVPQHRWLWSIQDEKAFHQRRYARSELVGRMQDQGFQIVRVTSFVSLLLPLMVLSRVTGRLAASRSEEYDPLRELKISPGLNAVMQAVCFLESMLLKSGVGLPAGGSLLCVGIKDA
jgi:SAM-dependent methyltransferase